MSVDVVVIMVVLAVLVRVPMRVPMRGVAVEVDSSVEIAVGTVDKGGGKFLGFGANNNPVVSSSTKAARFELLDNYNLTPSTSLCYALLEQTTDDGIATGIESLSDSPLMERWAETEGWESASLSDDIAAVYYYDLQGRRIGYALPAGQTVVAHIVLRNGASIVRKIKVGK